MQIFERGLATGSLKMCDRTGRDAQPLAQLALIKAAQLARRAQSFPENLHSFFRLRHVKFVNHVDERVTLALRSARVRRLESSRDRHEPMENQTELLTENGAATLADDQWEEARRRAAIIGPLANEAILERLFKLNQERSD